MSCADYRSALCDISIDIRGNVGDVTRSKFRLEIVALQFDKPLGPVVPGSGESGSMVR
jgi:hypothetical protein